MAVGQVDSRFAIDDQGRALPMGATHRYYRFEDAAVANADARFAIPPGAAFVNVESNTNAIRIHVVEEDPTPFATGNAGKFGAENTRPARPVEVGEVLKIQHDDGLTDVGGFTIVLEGRNLPDAITLTLGA